MYGSNSETHDHPSTRRRPLFSSSASLDEMKPPVIVTSSEDQGGKKPSLSPQPSTDFTCTNDWSSAKNIYANQYNDTSKRFRGFWNLMLLWKGSVLKLIWHDLLVFLVCFSLLSLLYRYVLYHDPVHREAFELLCVFCSR